MELLQYELSPELRRRYTIALELTRDHARRHLASVATAHTPQPAAPISARESAFDGVSVVHSGGAKGGEMITANQLLLAAALMMAILSWIAFLQSLPRTRCQLPYGTLCR